MDVILIPGLWLDGSVWADTTVELERRGATVSALTPPGQGDGRQDQTLADQRDAVIAAVDSAAGPPVLVGHSAAATLAWLAADARPERVGRVVMVGGFPGMDGEPYAAFFPLEDGVMPFPGWEPFDGPDTADLDANRRARLAAAMHPVPGAVATGIVRYTDERRHGVPVTLVCPEFGPDDAREWLAGGQLPELAAVANLTLVDLDSGHWPMVTRPAELAEAILDAPRPER